MNDPLIALVAVLCNASAQVAMKFAGRAGVEGSGLMAWLSPWLVGAVALYGMSFLLTIRVFARNELSVASPLMAGLTFACILLASWLILGETIDLRKVGGIVLILAGIAAITWR